jgi:hypothetical protein
VSEILAGGLFGAGLHIKFNGTIYLPLALLVLWLRHRGSPQAGQATTKSGLVLLTSLLLSFTGVYAFIGEGGYAQMFQQSWQSHIAPTQSLEYASPAAHPFPWRIKPRRAFLHGLAFTAAASALL